MPSKRFQEPLMEWYEQFNFFAKFAKKHKYKSDFPPVKMVGKFLTKKVSQPPRRLVFFSKKGIKNNDFRPKNMKNSKSQKITSKGVQEPLIKSYEQILNLRFRKFKSYFPLENSSLMKKKAKLLMDKGSQPHRKVVKFFIMMGTLHTALHVWCTQIRYIRTYTYSHFLSTVLLFSFIPLSLLFYF